MSTAERTTRRRGDALVEAILEATMAELAASGYEAFTIEGVAELAQTGKASIYRRWPTKLELALDAVEANMPSLGEAPDTGTVRGDLLEIMHRIDGYSNSQSGTALRACMTDLKSHAELAEAIHGRLVPPRKRVIVEVLERGVQRGEVRPDALTDRVIELAPRLLHMERLERGRPLDEADLVAILDEVVLPLLRPLA